MKKGLIIIFVMLFSAFLFNVSAISLEVEKKAVSNTVITEIDAPAVFNFTIKNLDGSDNFQIYSLAGADFIPRETFNIAGGETKTIAVRAYLDNNLKSREGLVNFVYKIKGQGSDIFSDILTVNVADFENAISIRTENIAPGSDLTKVIVENKFGVEFPEIKAKFSSAFFKDFDKSFSLAPYEKKEISVELDKLKVAGLSAGQYLLSAEMKAGEFEEEMTGIIKYVEKSGLSVNERSSGIFFREKVIEKKNEGNIPTLADASIRKNIISRLFTRVEPEPSNVHRKGLSVYYSWSRELRPGESLTVRAETSYLYLLLIVALIAVLGYLVFIYKNMTLSVRKRVNFVKVKGGEFALKISIYVSAKKFIEKISVIDRFPGIVKLYERFGAYPPDKVDALNRRLEWNIESLQPGEERIFSYLVYSKVGVVGRFELPPALAVYEKDGKIHETLSNRAFFMNEPRKNEDD